MKPSDWSGVLPAITTPFQADGSVDLAFLANHANWMMDAGCRGIVALGSLGEGATLTFEEKGAILSALVDAIGDRGPVIAGVSALSTADAVRLAQEAERRGCKGLMVLPPYVYNSGDWREARAHVETVFESTGLSCMLYNNPIAYGLDFKPDQVAQLCIHQNLHAVKESSADIRRIAAIRALVGDRLAILVGVDDVLVEGVAAGAVGWIAGLVNAFPKESVDLFDLAAAGRWHEAERLYHWFLPLLRLDTVPKFVQYIKLTQQVVGMGDERVRAPRLQVVGDERDEVLGVIQEALRNAPEPAH